MTGSEVDRKPPENQTAPRKRRPRGRPKGTRINVQQSGQLLGICTRLKLEGPLFTFRDVAAAVSKRAGFRVSLGTIHRFSQGVEPEGNKLRQALGLPLYKSAPVCPKCGVVHVRMCRQLPAWVNRAVVFLRSRERV